MWNICELIWIDSHGFAHPYCLPVLYVWLLLAIVDIGNMWQSRHTSNECGTGQNEDAWCFSEVNDVAYVNKPNTIT